MTTKYLNTIIPYLPNWKVRCKLLTKVAWELAVVLGLRKDPCKWYLELPTTLRQLAPITPLQMVVKKKSNNMSQYLTPHPSLIKGGMGGFQTFRFILEMIHILCMPNS
jgi:hypothetical protein